MEKMDGAGKFETVAVPVIPEFKPAAVGKDKQRRGAGLPWLPAAAGGSSSPFAALLGSKFGFLGLLMTVSAAGWGLGKTLASYQGAAARMVPEIFKPRVEGAAERDPIHETPAALPDGISLVKGSAAPAGAGGAPAQSPAAEAAGSGPSAAGRAADNAAVTDPAMIAKAAATNAAAPPGEALGSRVGGLSSSLSSGGTSASYQRSLLGGQGLSAGISRSFDQRGSNATRNGRLSGLKSATGRMRSAVAGRAGGGTRKAFDQALIAGRMGRLAGSGADDSRATRLRTPFDTGAQETVGGGVSQGAVGPMDNQPGAFKQQGGPIGTGADTKPKCGEGETRSGDACVPQPQGKSKDDADPITNVLRVLLGVAAALLLIQAVAAKLKWWPPDSVASTLIGVALIALGLAIVGLSVALIARGRPLMGSVYAVSGGLIAYLAYVGSFTAAAKNLVNLAAGGAITGALAALQHEEKKR